MNEKICCFFGHRKVKDSDELRENIYKKIKWLITEKSVYTFLFGSKSQFDDICYKIVSMLKLEYPQICRVYVRAEFPYIDDDYTNYLLQKYEDTYYPKRALNAGKSVYIKRNYEIIDKSDFCVVYYNENYQPPKQKNSKKDLMVYQPNSGTKIAYEYAQKKNKVIINVIEK